VTERRRRCHLLVSVFLALMIVGSSLSGPALGGDWRGSRPGPKNIRGPPEVRAVYGSLLGLIMSANLGLCFSLTMKAGGVPDLESSRRPELIDHWATHDQDYLQQTTSVFYDSSS
jgi:hypothetical protein